MPAWARRTRWVVKVGMSMVVARQSAQSDGQTTKKTTTNSVANHDRRLTDRLILLEERRNRRPDTRNERSGRGRGGSRPVTQGGRDDAKFSITMPDRQDREVATSRAWEVMMRTGRRRRSLTLQRAAVWKVAGEG